MRRLVLFVAACGGAGAPPLLGNQAPVPPRPACSEARIAELEGRLRAEWNVTGQLYLRCTAGTFPDPGYFIEAIAADLNRTGVVAADGKTTIVPFVDQARPLDATSVIDYATVELDGDGIDEIVETWRRSPHPITGSDHWLVIRRIADQKFERIEGPHLSVFHPELGGCTAEVQLAGRTLVIRVEKLSGIPPSDCLSPGTHTFALRDDAVVETTR